MREEADGNTNKGQFFLVRYQAQQLSFGSLYFGVSDGFELWFGSWPWSSGAAVGHLELSIRPIALVWVAANCDVAAGKSRAVLALPSPS